MFSDNLLDSAWENRSRRGWTTLASFALQTLGIIIVLMLPLIYSEGIPKLHLVLASAPIGPPPGPPPVPQHHATSMPLHSNLFHGIVVAPPTIPLGVTHVVDDSSPQDTAPCTICVPGGVGPISGANPLYGSAGTGTPVVPPPPAPAIHPPRISHMMEGNLIYKVQPIYPPLARVAHIQGAVMLRAVISRRGTIENLQVISGHPMLVRAAMDAVLQWRYRPYVLNGDPVEVETQVTVNFSLSGS